jgi:hypothetical protein
MAVFVIEAGLILAGRIEEALATFDRRSGPDLGVIGDLAGVLHGLALVLAGREAEAVPRIERAAQTARLLDAAPTARAAAALLAEIRGDTVGLPPIPERARSVSDALVLRAHRAAGDPEAAEALRRAARDLAMPGLLLDS